MSRFLAPPSAKAEMTGPGVDARYKRLRMQVFTGAFVGYAAFYLVRNNFAMAMPALANMGIDKGDLGTVFAMNAIAYALSKFLMGSVSDRSDARKFLPLGLVLASLAMFFMMWPFKFFDLQGHPEQKNWCLIIVGALNFLVGWFNGMGWPPCGRIMTHWFSISERGTWMSIWNCAHNVGGALVGPMASYGALWFGSWFFGQNEKMYDLVGAFVFPAAVGLLIAIVAYVLLRDTPQSQGLPSIEKWRNDYPKNYSAKSEEVLTTKEIFFKYVLNNKFLWFIACANAFIYMVRYGALNWAPTILAENGFNFKEAGWAYFAYEIAAIPGTLFCGWLSDKVFKGRRAIPTIIFMAAIIGFLILYWQFYTNITMAIVCLIGIGFLIYGPVMLIGVQALDLAPKNAAGTAAGLTGFFGYFFGTALLANMFIGWVADNWGWDWTFVALIVACLLSIFFMALTYKEEQYLVERNRSPRPADRDITDEDVDAPFDNEKK